MEFPRFKDIIPGEKAIRQFPGKVGGALVRLTHYNPETPLSTHSDHFQRGSDEMLLAESDVVHPDAVFTYPTDHQVADELKARRQAREGYDSEGSFDFPDAS